MNTIDNKTETFTDELKDEIEHANSVYYLTKMKVEIARRLDMTGETRTYYGLLIDDKISELACSGRYGDGI